MDDSQISAESTKLDDVIAEYIFAEEAGEAVSREDLLKQHPDMSGELKEFFADRDRFKRLASPLGDESSRHNDLPATVRYFGDYELLEEVAAGGMGVVYKARQTSLNRIVSLKMIRAGHLASDEDIHRFKEEAKTAANLKHKAIVPIYEVGQQGGQHYFSMEYIEGQNLADRIRTDPPSPDRAARIIKTIASAIDYAHQQGTVHRDLKPSNILIDEFEQVHVTDFGLAMRVESNSDVTRTGQIMGTACYMPPEQARGARKLIGPRSDIYSLGAVLYELLTGRPPFRGESTAATLTQLLDSEPLPPSRLDRKVPADLETICLTCLEKDPDKRYSEASLLADDLGRFLVGAPILARPVSRAERAIRWCRREPVVALLSATVALLLIAGTCVSTYFAIRANIEAERAKESAGDAADRAEELGEALALLQQEKDKTKEQKRLARRGNYNIQLARARSVINIAPKLALALLNNEASCPLDLREFARNYYVREAQKREPVFQVACRVSAVSPNGQRIAFIHRKEGSWITVRDLATGDAESSSFGTFTPAALRFSRDGQSITSLGWKQDYANRVRTGSLSVEVSVWDVRKCDRLSSTKTKSLRVPLLSMDGSTFAVEVQEPRAIQLWRVDSGEATVKIPVDSAILAMNGDDKLSLSPDGSRLAAVTRENSVVVWDDSGKMLATLKGAVHPINSLRFSPDSSMLIATCDVRPGEKDFSPRESVLWRISSATETVRFHHPHVSRPRFSIDGKKLACRNEDFTNVWDTSTGSVVNQLDVSSSVAFDRSGTILALLDKSIQLIDLDTLAQLGSLRLPKSESRTKRTLLSLENSSLFVKEGNRLTIWRELTLERGSFQGHRSQVTDLAFDKSGTIVGSSHARRGFSLWDADTGQRQITPSHHFEAVWSIALARDKDLFAWSSNDRVIRLCDAKSGEQNATLHGHRNVVRCVRFLPDDNALASVDEGGTIILWDLKSQSPKWTVPGSGKTPRSMAISTDGTVLAVEGDDHSVRLFYTANGRHRGRLTGHTAAVNSIAFSADSRTLASASADETIRIWDIVGLVERQTLHGHFGAVNGVSFTPDGRTLASVGDDATVKLWDPETGQERASFWEHSSRTTAVTFSDCGEILATGDADGHIKLWLAGDLKEQPRFRLAAKRKATSYVHYAPYKNSESETSNWAQWGGSPHRNNATDENGAPTDWDAGTLDRALNSFVDGKNRLWHAVLGSQSYGNPVLADGQIYVGTNNMAGYLPRYPYRVDLGVLLCFATNGGSFLWQFSAEKLPTGRVHDWEQQGICSSPLIEGERMWFVSNRGEVVCLDTQGFHDDEDDGPVQDEWVRLFNIPNGFDQETDKQLVPALAALNQGRLSDYTRSEFARVRMPLPGGLMISTEGEATGTWTFSEIVQGERRHFRLRREGPKLAAYAKLLVSDKDEADVIWRFDMMKELGVSQHNMATCGPTAWGDVLFICTSNGVDVSHLNIPSPDAPSFIAMDKNTGEVLWQDSSPGNNVLHGQWSIPAVGEFNGVPQVIFPGGDGWVRSFRADRWKDGKPELVWKFDANPKTSKWILGGRGTRNNIIAPPVIYDGLLYIAVGQDPEHGEGIGHLWCINPNQRGDVSPELAFRLEGDKRVPLEHRRVQAVIEENGELAVANPNSAVVWHYSQVDRDGDGKFQFEETMHRSTSAVAIKDDLLYISDFSGLFHCLDARTGKPHFTYDMFAQAWGTPLIVDDLVYVGDEDGDVCVFELDKHAKEPITEINMGSSVYTSPIFANGILYIASRSYLFAIQKRQKTFGR